MGPRILRRLSRYDEEYAVRGDLDEEFAERFRDSGRRRAVRWYRKQAFFALAVLSPASPFDQEPIC
ncbi:MAG: hypothetical protein M0C28_08100 [Candidatus Moduliflexus flocculans]|nr:hypothetical protein [Candidatus Moduliflexus flocculans]